jgi:drug/metabolite transporter (DMT)-like permease
MTKTEANIVLLSVVLCWASSYIFVKNIPPAISSFAYLTLTTGIGSLILAVVFFRKLREFDRKTLLRSLLVAAVICTYWLFERFSLSRIPASLASFLVVSSTLIFVPLFLLFLKKKPSLNNIAGILLILIGLAFSGGLRTGTGINLGVLTMTTGCVFMALYIIMVDNFTKKSDPLLLGIGQMFFSALLSFALWSGEEPRTFFAVVYTKELLANIFLLAFFAKAYAYIMLMYAQKYATPITVTVITSTEPVVTMVLALLIPNSFGQTELLSESKVIGAVVIAAGAICAGMDFLSRKNRPNQVDPAAGG